MDLNDEQKARAQSLADAVGDEPGKYFGGILSDATEKSFNKVLELLKSGKMHFNEKYPQISQHADRALSELEVTKEAYRIWYEKSGRTLVEKEKELIKASFDQAVEKLQFFAEGVKMAAEKVMAGFKKE